MINKEDDYNDPAGRGEEGGGRTARGCKRVLLCVRDSLVLRLVWPLLLHAVCVDPLSQSEPFAFFIYRRLSIRCGSIRSLP